MTDKTMTWQNIEHLVIQFSDPLHDALSAVGPF
jgi:hypothetical protein